MARPLAVPVVLLAWLTGCQDSLVLESSDVPLPGLPVLSISDGEHGGNPHFFFLPPLASRPFTSGDFDPARRPTVQVCVWSGTACGAIVARFSMEGTGPEVITVDPEGESYGLVWMTENYDLDLWISEQTIYRLTVYTGTVPLGHADFYVRNRRFSCSGTCPPSGTLDIVKDRPLPIRFRIEEGWLTQTIAFNSDRDGSLQVYVMNADGSGQAQLTAGGVANGEPDWSPDGSRVAFYSWRDAVFPDNWTSEIYTMDPDGANPTRLTTDNLIQAEAAWSPDGGTILVHGYTGGIGVPAGDMEVYAVAATTGSLTNLTQNPSSGDGGGTWSPDGRQIAFQSLRGGFGWELFTMNRDGSNLRNLTIFHPFYDVTPKWSPDGSKILFVSFRDFNTEIYVANADGTNQQRLTTNLSDDIDPAWSPDGSRIVFASNRDGDFDIYVMDANGANVRQLTNAPGGDGAPEWRR
jgi:TolB protein